MPRPPLSPRSKSGSMVERIHGPRRASNILFCSPAGAPVQPRRSTGFSILGFRKSPMLLLALSNPTSRVFRHLLLLLELHQLNPRKYFSSGPPARMPRPPLSPRSKSGSMVERIHGPRRASNILFCSPAGAPVQPRRSTGFSILGFRKSPMLLLL